MEILQNHTELACHYLTTQIGVKRAYFFGSFARNEQNENSDVDILLELEYKNNRFDYFIFCTIQEKLQQIYQRKTDVITENGLSDNIRHIIQKEKILFYERQK